MMPKGVSLKKLINSQNFVSFVENQDKKNVMSSLLCLLIFHYIDLIGFLIAVALLWVYKTNSYLILVIHEAINTFDM